VKYNSIDELSEKERKTLETRIFCHDLATVWRFVEEYFTKVDIRQLQRGKENPKIKMALIFRWYLGNSSRWATQGDESRKMDMQIWCGKSMGAFNRWVEGTQLEHWSSRTVVKVADKIMSEAAATIDNYINSQKNTAYVKEM
jgi:PfaD family protein